MRTSLPVRLNVLLLSLLTIGPVIALLIYFNIQQLRHAQEIEAARLEYIAQIIASENSQIIEGARQLLISLAASPQIANPSECDTFLRNLLSKYQRYANFGVADLQGNVICSSLSASEKINISDRYSFGQTLASGNFTVGEYTQSKITGRPVLNFGYPLNSPAGVIYASLDLSWLGEVVSNLDLDEQMSVQILDRNGTILASYPQALPPQQNLVSATQKIGEAEEGPYVAVSMPKSTIFRRSHQDFAKNIFLSLGIAIFSLIVGWLIGNSLISKVIAATRGVEELKRDFVSLVTHQIRTPITAIKWFTQILASGSAGKLTSKQQEILKDTSTSVTRMTNLIDTLLIIAKLESGKIPLNLQKTDLNRLVTDCHNEINSAYPSKKIKFWLKSHPQRVRVFVDPKLIAQCVSNLISNAYKYSRPANTVTVLIEKTKNRVQVTVQDRGIGISPGDGQRIWDKFTRGSNAHTVDTEGAGLGLYLAKLIVEAHRGHIWYESLRKNSTSFIFTIPTNLG